MVVYAHVSKRYRMALVTSSLLVAEGWREDEHADVPIVHLIASRLIDRSDLLTTLGTIDGQEDAAPAEKTLGRADEVKRPEPGSRHPTMAPTRNFR